jgi:alpha-ketoglutarate-dependent taurine dioxygenase
LFSACQRLTACNASCPSSLRATTQKDLKAGSRHVDFLYQHASRPEFQTRFRWQEGSIAFWDNRATWHYALNDYHGERRLMHRITIDGVPLQPAD